MKGNFLQIAVGSMLLVLCAGAEELLPKFLGVGFPLLLTAAQAVAAGRGSSFSVVLFAGATGAMEDALCALPPMASVSYFLLVAVLTRWLAVPRMLGGLAYAGYQLWLVVWTSSLGGSVFVRLLLALPIGFATAWAVGVAVEWWEGKVAIHEEG